MARQLGRAVSRAGAWGALAAIVSILASSTVAAGLSSRAVRTPTTMAPTPTTAAPTSTKAAPTSTEAAAARDTVSHRIAPETRTLAKGGTAHAVLIDISVKKGTSTHCPAAAAAPRAQPVRRAVTSITPIEQWVPHLRPIAPAPKRVRAPGPVRAPRAAGAAKPPSPSLPIYRAGTTGYDISQYQCSDIPAARSAVAIVQVSGGALNSAPNPCYVQEAWWAGSRLSAYIYLNGLSGPTFNGSMVGPRSWCARAQPVCRAYNFGFDWASHWLAYSRQLGINPKLWWLDVEVGSGWTFPMINDGVIQGAANALRSQGVTIGIYSTASQWATITGGLAFPGVQLWTAGAGNLTGPGQTATAYCKSPGDHTFADGHLRLVQWGYTGGFPGAYPALAPYDYDYVCN